MNTVRENDAKPRASPAVTTGEATWPGNSGGKNIPKSTGLEISGEGDVRVWGPMRRLSCYLNAHKHEATA